MKKLFFVFLTVALFLFPRISSAQDSGEEMTLKWTKLVSKPVTFIIEENFPRLNFNVSFSGVEVQYGNPPEKFKARKPGIDWKGLALGWGTFLTVEHGIRLTNPRVRSNLGGNYWLDWKRSVRSIHGFPDGDRWFANYVGHPWQGSVSMFVFARHDPYNQNAKFGKNRRYVLSKTRQFFAGFAYSECFEVCPFLSETSLGNLGYQYGHNSWGDQIVTPTLGLVWSVFEDWVYAKYIAKVRKTNPERANVLLIILNPTRSVANLLSFTYPWRGPVPG